MRREVRYQGNSLQGVEQEWFENGRRQSVEVVEQGIRTQGVVWHQLGEVVEAYELDEQDTLFAILQLSRRLWGEEVVDAESPDADRQHATICRRL